MAQDPKTKQWAKARRKMKIEAPFTKYFLHGFIETMEDGREFALLFNRNNWSTIMELERYHESVRTGRLLSLEEWYAYLDRKHIVDKFRISPEYFESLADEVRALFPKFTDKQITYVCNGVGNYLRRLNTKVARVEISDCRFNSFPDPKYRYFWIDVTTEFLWFFERNIRAWVRVTPE